MKKRHRDIGGAALLATLPPPNGAARRRRHRFAPKPGQRIVSLAPHVTECCSPPAPAATSSARWITATFPEAAKALPKVGGYSRIDLEAVAASGPTWSSAGRAAMPPPPSPSCGVLASGSI
jgi:ABC-type hemin transport system substrate-binding protein